jgi:hypothetical protein
MAAFAPHSPSLLHRLPRSARIFVLLVVVCGGVHFCLDPLLTWATNRRLQAIPGIKASVGRVHLTVYPGRLAVEAVAIDLCPDSADTTAQSPRPLLRAQRLATTWKYRALLRGWVAGDLEADSPEVTLYKLSQKKASAPRSDKMSSGEAAESVMRWRAPLQRLIPLRVDAATVRDASVRFVDTTVRPQVTLAATDVSLQLRNLTNRAQLKAALYATANLRATVPGSGALALDLKLDPLARTPTFALNTQLRHVQLVELSEALRAYGSFDVTAGRFDVYSEVAAHGGQFEGYVKPLFHEVHIRIWRKGEADNGPVQLAWRAAVGAVVGVLKNKAAADQVGTKLPFEGRFDSPHLGVWDAVAELLGNAFVRALLPQLEQSAAIEHLPK